MGVVVDVSPWVPVGAPLVAVLLLVVGSLTSCAVSELVLRLAVRLYSKDPSVRTQLREEWLRILLDMKPAERPAHSGSLLWLGVRSRALRARQWSLRRAIADALRAAAIAREEAIRNPLNDLERAMLEHFVAGESASESGRAFGLSAGAFTSRLNRILEKLESADLAHLGRPKNVEGPEAAGAGTDN